MYLNDNNNSSHHNMLLLLVGSEFSPSSLETKGVGGHLTKHVLVLWAENQNIFEKNCHK